MMLKLARGFLLVGMISAALPAYAEDTPAPAATAAPAVTVVAAAHRVITDNAIITGTLVAREEVYVVADVAGFKIESLLVDAGDVVTEGQVLARLSTDSIDIQLSQITSQLARSEAAIAQAKAQILQAEANVTQAQAALQRAQELKAKGVVAQDLLDQRVAAAESASANLAVAQQGLTAAEADKAVTEATRANLELSRSKTEIKAPAAGLVLARSTNVGAIVSAASGPLFRIARNSEIELDGEATETVLARVTKDQPVEITPAGADKPLKGKVRLVQPEINATTRLGHIRISVAASEQLKVGAFAHGLIELARHDSVALPVAAVQSVGGISTVQLVKDNVVSTVTVETGLSGDGFVEITKGLAEGDVVVARAGTFLRDGDTVRAVPASNEGAKG